MLKYEYSNELIYIINYLDLYVLIFDNNISFNFVSVLLLRVHLNSTAKCSTFTTFFRFSFV